MHAKNKTSLKLMCACRTRSRLRYNCFIENTLSIVLLLFCFVCVIIILSPSKLQVYGEIALRRSAFASMFIARFLHTGSCDCVFSSPPSSPSQSLPSFHPAISKRKDDVTIEWHGSIPLQDEKKWKWRREKRPLRWRAMSLQPIAISQYKNDVDKKEEKEELP